MGQTSPIDCACRKLSDTQKKELDSFYKSKDALDYCLLYDSVQEHYRVETICPDKCYPGGKTIDEAIAIAKQSV